MITYKKWWQLVGRERLVTCLCLLNQANRASSEIEKSRQYLKALKEICCIQNSSFESGAPEKFLLEHLNDRMRKAILEDETLKELALHKPQIIDYQVILDSKSDFSDIDGETKQKTTKDHRQLSSAFKNFDAQRNYEETRLSLLKKLSQFLCLIESNIYLFDTIKERGLNPDKRIYEVHNSFIDSFFGITFDYPLNRLASYGTLRPGESNFHQVDTIAGEWIPGSIKGTMSEKDGYPVFNWSEDADVIPVQVLLSKDLPDHWSRLDDFEGPNYERILVPVRTERHGLIICSLYNSR